MKDPVLLIYTYLSLKDTTWIPTDQFVMRRLNSPDWLERFVGILIVMRYNTGDLSKMRKIIFPRLAASELISDVRDLIELSIFVRSSNPLVCFASEIVNLTQNTLHNAV